MTLILPRNESLRQTRGETSCPSGHRRSPASPGLVRAVVRASSAEDGSGDRDVFRDLLKRLLRLTAFLDVDRMGEAELTALVTRERAVSLSHLGR